MGLFNTAFNPRLSVFIRGKGAASPRFRSFDSAAEGAPKAGAQTSGGFAQDDTHSRAPRLRGESYEQPLVEPHDMQRKHEPLRVMIAPQTWQLGASPMSTTSFKASAACW